MSIGDGQTNNHASNDFKRSRHWRVSEEVFSATGVNGRGEEREVLINSMRKGGALYDVPDPESYDEAMNGEYAENWRQAASAEIGSRREWRLGSFLHILESKPGKRQLDSISPR
mmetsp:Transcript_12918/g.51504  ORF Transcript_12918/g.51504 Transcript_12918/m.51504 type:complete len:114 (-) Transcript_12918:428-769(-)